MTLYLSRFENLSLGVLTVDGTERIYDGLKISAATPVPSGYGWALEVTDVDSYYGGARCLRAYSTDASVSRAVGGFMSAPIPSSNSDILATRAYYKLTGSNTASPELHGAGYFGYGYGSGLLYDGGVPKVYTAENNVSANTIDVFITRNQWFRLETLRTGSGLGFSVTYRFFTGSNVEGTTPSATWASSSTGNACTPQYVLYGDPTGSAWGATNSIPNDNNIYIDCVAYSDVASWIGPVSTEEQGPPPAAQKMGWGIPAV